MARPTVDAADAYRLMVRMRLVDSVIARAWADGLVPGEYHSGIGEEAINAGVLLALGPDDALALDHRNTAPLIGRGTDPEGLLLEVLGADTGMNRGMAGHMHLIDPEVRAAGDGIVGAAGPLAVGQAIAAQRLRPGAVAVAFHGEAAMNQGMLMEAYNLAVAWRLPVLFVCKDNKWSITTHSADVTGKGPVRRAKGFGLATASVAGHRVAQVHAAAAALIQRARDGGGPGFLHATCHRPGGHFEGDPLVRVLEHPRREAENMAPGLLEGAGGAPREGARGLAVLGSRIGRAAGDRAFHHRDPLFSARRLLPVAEARAILREEATALLPAVSAARAAVADRPVFGVAQGGPS
jgi:pyruvate dehydrogenase E1 component alpha subunit